MLFFGKKKKSDVQQSTNLEQAARTYQSNYTDLNAPLPASTIPVVGQTIPTENHNAENVETPTVDTPTVTNVTMEAVSPNAVPTVDQEKAAPTVEPVTPPTPEVAPAIEPVTPPTPEVAPAVEPVTPPMPEVAPVVEPVTPPMPEVVPVTPPMPEVAPAVEPVTPPTPEVAPTVEPVTPNNNQTNDLFVDQPKPTNTQPAQPTSEPKFCPNCGNKVEGDTCILCGTKVA